MTGTRGMGGRMPPAMAGNRPGETQYPASSAMGGNSVAGVSTESMDRFVQCFERSARRWEIVVYPALFAFVLLAGYGFFLIYSLTADMRVISRSLDPNMSVNMDVMARNITEMTVALSEVSRNMQSVSGNLADVSQKMDALDPILLHMTNMDNSIRAMVVANDQMRQSMAVMTHSIGRPMSFMNSFLP